MNVESLNILLITDVRAEAEHSAVEGLFKFESDSGVACKKVYFDRTIRKPRRLSDRIVLPHRHRRYGLWRTLKHIVNLEQFNIIIVRNLFAVLQQVQSAGPAALVGFWESFPHSYRRLEQAYLEQRAVWRKRLEYVLAERRERRLIQACDFYLPITQTHKDIFYPDLSIPYLATPMGFDFQRYPQVDSAADVSGPIRFVFIGSIDKLRSLDMVATAFLSQQQDFILDIYSDSRNEAVDAVKSIHDRRIRCHPGLPREELFREIATADVGVCFFPHTKTYIGASPTKTVEYAALGLGVLVNPMPDYETILDGGCAFICNFDTEAIKKEIRKIFHEDRESLRKRGQQLHQRVLAARDYRMLSSRLVRFIREQFY